MKEEEQHEQDNRFRRKAEPAPGDEAYLHLVDLSNKLRTVLAESSGTWLDFGAATSPYRGLMPMAKLRTADLASAAGRYDLDYILDAEGTVPVDGEVFDGVLSTQVLEHVVDVDAYLAESYRVLKPGGRLVLSTHGVWEDHAVIDLWRWTALGLSATIERAGFEISECTKLTCDARAVLLLLLRQSRQVRWPGFSLPALLLNAMRRVDRWRPTLFDAYAERRLRPLAAAGTDDCSLYITVLITARRP